MMNRGIPVITACPPKLLREGREELEVKLCMSKALRDDCLPSRSLGEDLVIHKAFDRFLRVGLDCFVASLLAMTVSVLRAAYDTYKLLLQTIYKCYMYLMNRFCIRTSLRAACLP